MAKTPDEILKELFDTIDTSIEKITNKADAQQKSILREVELLIKDLSLDENGNIKSTIGNLKLINKINAKLEKVILTPEYKKSVSDFVKSFTEVEELQNRYYRDVFNEFVVPKTSQELKELTIQATIKDLTESGLNSNVSNAISNLISSNIKGKQSYDSLRTQLKDYILGTKEKNGRLLSYVNQITSDSLNTYSAEYDKIITDVIQPQWFKYVGSIILDSRPFCKAVVDKKWVHKSELVALSRGEVDGEKVSTQGFKPNTDKENIIINRGGWNCRHKFVAVSEEVVPDKIKAKFAEEKPKVEEPQIVKFVPAKTIKEAEEYAKNNLNIKYVNYKGVNIDIANDMNSAIFNIKQYMPTIRTNGIGSAQEANKAIKQEIKDWAYQTEYYKDLKNRIGEERAKSFIDRTLVNSQVSNVGKDTLAWSTGNQSFTIKSTGEKLDLTKYLGVYVNNKFAKSKEEMDKIVTKNSESGWFTKGAKDFAYIMTHEIGHEIDKSINFKSDERFLEIFNRERNLGIDLLSKKLSRYGATAGGNARSLKDEMIAEAWAEYITSESPRPLSKEIGELMLKRYFEINNNKIDITFDNWINELKKILKK